MNEQRDELDSLLHLYREACTAPDPSADFMPRLWAKIEERQTFWFSFTHLSRAAATAAAAMCLLLALLNFSHNPYSSVISYPDALAASHSAERTFYAEGIRNSSVPDDGQ